MPNCCKTKNQSAGRRLDGAVADGTGLNVGHGGRRQLSFCSRLCVLCAFAFISFGCAAHPAAHGIPNLAQVSPGIYRGGQPNNDGWAYLKSVGVSNVVELNDARLQEEEVETEFTFQRFPISFARQIFGPSRLTVCDAVASIQPGTFVHCAHGQDRTGLIAAEYRVWREGWTRDQARAEMLQHGFHRCLFGLEWFWKNE